MALIHVHRRLLNIYGDQTADVSAARRRAVALNVADIPRFAAREAEPRFPPDAPHSPATCRAPRECSPAHFRTAAQSPRGPSGLRFPACPAARPLRLLPPSACRKVSRRGSRAVPVAAGRARSEPRRRSAAGMGGGR